MEKMGNNKQYRICSKTIMDTTDEEITFDVNGISNHYYEYLEKANKLLLPAKEREIKLQSVIETIKKSGLGKEYDCLIGLSGGVDSSYLAYIAKKYGLRPLAVHFDNGWNSELAVKNIENIVKKLNIDYETYVIDWEEFKDIQRSFFYASVANVEVPTDHAIFAVMNKMASERGIKYILSGSNVVTEAILPNSWGYDASDLVHLKGIHSKYGKLKLKSFPQLSFTKFLYITQIKKVTNIRLLNLLNYNKSEAMEVLKQELNWVYYGGKHYESTFTKFFQAFYLPTKFGIDKRKAHLSTLICSGQITREQALEEIKEPLYDEKSLIQDKEYVLKKLDFSENEWEQIMNSPIKTYKDYPNNEKLKGMFYKFYNLIR